MIIDLQDRVSIVTGGAKGIGKVIARSLLNEKMKVAVWDIDREALKKTNSELSKEFGKNFIGIECDVSDEKSVGDALNKTINTFQTIDVLVANAGLVSKKKVSELMTEDWDNVFATNSKGAFICSKIVAEEFKKKKKGRIIIASSFASIIPSVGSAAYSASKSAVNSLTRVLAAELGQWNITVNAYAPGMIPTEMLGLEEITAEKQKKMLDTLAIRKWGDAKDIASLVIFLASDYSSYITGSLINISGGKFSVQFNEFARDS